MQPANVRNVCRQSACTHFLSFGECRIISNYLLFMVGEMMYHMNLNKRIFIGFAAEDRYDIVEPIVYHLKNYGIELWYDRHMIVSY